MARGSVKARPSTDGKRVSYRVKWETRGPDGKRKHHSATRSTKKEADALLIEKQKEVNDGAYVDSSTEPLGAYLARWLEAIAPTVSESTIHSRTSIIKTRIVPALGRVPLAQLDPITIQTFYADQARRYAPATVRHTHMVLGAALARAVKWRLIPRNPTDDALLPSLPRPTATVWSAAECATFLQAVRKENHRFLPLWQLALDSGMRAGELLALTWRDVALDRDNPTVSVHRTVTRGTDGRYKLGEFPKTKASRRSIVIGDVTVTALRAYRINQHQRRLQLGPRWHNHDLVFDRGDGELIHPSVIRGSLDRLLDRNPSIPRLTMHGLRHTMATLALEGGINPKVVQERLGHATIQMTMDRYSHVTQSMQVDAADIINALLLGHSRPKRGQSAG